MSKCHICGKGENGDENWSGCPEINTQSIQILATSQALQLTPSIATAYQTNRPVHIIDRIPEFKNLGREVLFPSIELDNTDPSQYFTDHLKTITCEVFGVSLW